MIKCGNDACIWYDEDCEDNCSSAGDGHLGTGKVEDCFDFQEYDDTDPDGGVYASTKGVRR